MDKINWFKGEEKGILKGVLYPFFLITTYDNGEIFLFIFDDLPQSIKIKSVQQGKLKAAKYLKERG